MSSKYMAIEPSGQLVDVVLLRTKKRLFRKPKYLVSFKTNHLGHNGYTYKNVFGEDVKIPPRKKYITNDTAWVTELIPSSTNPDKGDSNE